MNDHRAASAPGKALGARRSLASHSGNGRLASPTAGTGVLGFGLSLSSGRPLATAGRLNPGRWLRDAPCSASIAPEYD